MNYAKLFSAIAFLSISSTTLNAQGAFDFLDYCEGIKDQYQSTYDAVVDGIDRTEKRLASWYDDPSTMPDSALDPYKDAIRLGLFINFSKSAAGKALIKVWKASDPNANPKELYFKDVYPNEINQEIETRLSQKLFQKDYEERLREKFLEEKATVHAELQRQRESLGSECKPDVLSQVFRATIGRSLLNWSRDADAAKREANEVTGLIRLTTGVSLKDIATHGLRGGEGSFLREAKDFWTDSLDEIGIGENNEVRRLFRNLDVTNLPLPPEVKITIDDRSIDNARKNLETLVDPLNIRGLFDW